VIRLPGYLQGPAGTNSEHIMVLQATLQTLVVTLVLSRLNYGNGVLIALSTYIFYANACSQYTKCVSATDLSSTSL